MFMHQTVSNVFEWFEQQNPKPVSVVPNIPADSKQQMGTVDKLAQSIVPRLVDKLNEANWTIQRLEYLCSQQQSQITDLYQALNNTVMPKLQQLEDNVMIPKPNRKSRGRKKKEPESPALDLTEIADYDPDTDTWGPMEIGGYKITGALLETLRGLGPAARQMYSEELVSFCENLSDDVKAAIANKFPTI